MIHSHILSGAFLLIILVTISIIPASASVINMSKDNAGAIKFYNLAVDKATAGKFEEAVNLTDQALSLQPNFTLALVTRTGVLLELDRFEEANRSLNAALNLEPEDTAVLTAAASYNLRTGQFTNAIRYADAVLDKDPQVIEAWIIKGTAHGELGEYQEEFNASTRALLIAPDNPELQTNLKYASSRMESGKKTPLSLATILVSLTAGILLLQMRRS